MKATKTFKIGEYAIGGKIRVKIIGKVIQIEAIDWYSDDVFQSGSTMITQTDARRQVDSFLNELTTSFYADKIMKWIESKVKFYSEFDLPFL